ncbi:MAG TPA: SDR family NAD(P)-dependent oxidoreductase [Mycobacteriales bacterium]|jgi:3-oxoacyl-[acyl-carrier protein] reductase|nr:SDR family NAD(P)-dependent oxidoreductase [Mycobacteriales bacterium]
MAKLTAGSRSVAGKVVLVTGAASGMGRATAHLFADEGAKVAVTDLGEDRVHAVVKEITDAGGAAQGWVLDVSDQTAVDRVVADIVSDFGALDILVNNAGIVVLGPVDGPSYLEDFQRTLEVDLVAHVRTIRAALPHLKRSGEGRIVNIASTEGSGATKYNSSYVAAKHGVIGLTRALAMELGEFGITVNCVQPGPIRTGMTDDIPEEAKLKFARRRVPLRRYGQPEEVAQMTLSLCLPAMSFVTGANVPVDGGLLIQNT